jgi:hypothetical protein
MTKMPNPGKKINNAPRNAQTDTGTGGGKTMMKRLKKANAEGASEAGATMMKKLTPTGQKKATPLARKTITEANGKGVNRRGSGEWGANPYVGRAGIPVTSRGPADDAGSYTATHAYDFYDEDHQDRVEGKENTFHSLQASGGSGGRVGKTDDPFVEGFNSNDTSFASRYRRYRRNRGDNRRQTK